MTDAEYIKTIPTLTNKELLEELDYCGYDSYYRTIREPVIEEITKRLNRIAELEKENAELKAQLESERDLPAIAYMQGAEKQKKKDEEELKKWKDEWQEQVQKATDEGYARTLQTIQLSKAKELLNEFLDFESSCMERGIYISDKTRAEAEQFISEVEKCGQ